MGTLNLSLPEKLALKVDETVEKEGYASRSEFIRNLLRFYFYSATEETKTGEFFLPFIKQPINQIESELNKSDLYSPEFIKSVIAGLKKSSLYHENKTAAE